MARITPFLSLLVLVPSMLQAQTPPGPPEPPKLAEQSLEDLMTIRVDTVAGASKREQLVTEAPSSVTVISAQEIATYGWRTLADVLRATRSFYITYDRNYAYLGARGFGRPTDYNNRVLVLVNGHRLNDNVYDAVGVGTDFPVDLALVERIEVIRGPGSALYGTSAFFAVVDVITKRGDGLAGVEGSVESASFNTWRTRGSFGTSDGNGRDLLLSVSHLSSRGAEALRFPEYDGADEGPGVSREADGDTGSYAFASARLGRLSLQGAFNERTKQLPTGAWGTLLSDPRTTTIDTRSWGDATWRSDWKGNDITARGFVDYMRYEGAYASVDGVSSDWAAGNWIGGEFMVSRRLSGRHQLTAGTEFREHLRQMQSLPTEDGPRDDSYRSRQLGLYVQDEIRLNDRWTAIFGARADYWSLDGWSAHPRGGLIYRPDGDTSLKVLYGSAYRAPNMFERFFTDGVFVANPLIRPETLRTGEVIAERYVGGRLRLTASAYVSQIKGLISQFESDTHAWYDNGDPVRSHGMEVEAERRWVNGLVLHASLTAQRTRDGDTGVRLSNSPSRLATARAEAPLFTRRATMAVDWQHVSSRLSNRGVEADAYALTHVTWRYMPHRFKGAIAASLYNVFDANYSHPVGAEFVQDLIGQDGRTFSLRLTVGF
jgi:outer membrane receptor for ferrienterochelin and colicins